jgi:MFS family permease
MIAMAFVKNWSQLAACRAILGIFEATLFPGAAYIIACWYPRKQMAVRNVVFYIISIVVSGLASILAYGCSLLHNRNGIQGWSWIFIVSVAASVCGSVAVAIDALLVLQLPANMA